VRLVVVNHVTLDGVMQAPGRPDEDTRGGFDHGGWAGPRNDDVMLQAVGRRMSKPGHGLLLGRRSYEDLMASWNAQGGPFKDSLNNTPKYVVSSNPSTRLKWPKSNLVRGDVPTAVADLKKHLGGDLIIMGSGRLIRSLLSQGLIDEFFLMIHPVVLGSGQRLFEPDNQVMPLRLVESTATTKGVILATYEPAENRPSRESRQINEEDHER
jgi:dihydrofolate reductase